MTVAACLAVLACVGMGPVVTAQATTTDGAGQVQSLAAVTARAEAAVRAALPTPPAPPATPSAPATAPSTATAPRHIVTGRRPDPRLRLAPCREELDAAVRVGPGGLGERIVVPVSCSGPSRWTVLVAVALETEAQVLVAIRDLARSAVPGPADVQVTTRTLPGISATYINNLNEIRGYQLARPVAAGHPLRRDALAAVPLVRRGEAVTLVANVAGLEVRVPGRALADARPGQPVRVQNVNSLKVVEGRADDLGMVRVDR